MTSLMGYNKLIIRKTPGSSLVSSRSGGTGRRAGFRVQWGFPRRGSNPRFGTTRLIKRRNLNGCAFRLLFPALVQILGKSKGLKATFIPSLPLGVWGLGRGLGCGSIQLLFPAGWGEAIDLGMRVWAGRRSGRALRVPHERQPRQNYQKSGQVPPAHPRLIEATGASAVFPGAAPH